MTAASRQVCQVGHAVEVRAPGDPSQSRGRSPHRRLPARRCAHEQLCPCCLAIAIASRMTIAKRSRSEFVVTVRLNIGARDPGPERVRLHLVPSVTASCRDIRLPPLQRDGQGGQRLLVVLVAARSSGWGSGPQCRPREIRAWSRSRAGGLVPKIAGDPRRVSLTARGLTGGAQVLLRADRRLKPL